MGNQNNNQNKKTLITLFTSIIAMVVTIVVNFFLSPYIVKTLGEEANGFTQLANTLVNYASLITVALNSMAGRFVTMHYYKGEIKESIKIYSSIMIANLAIIVLLIFPASVMVYNLENIVNISTADVLHVKILFALVFCNFFVAQINSVLGIATYVCNKQYIVNSINAVKTVLNAMCLLFAFSIFTPKIYYVSLVAALLSVVSVPVYFVISKKVLPELRIDYRYFSMKTIWSVFSSGIWNVVNQCGNVLMTGVDLLLANLYVGPLAMGILSVSKVMPNCVIQIAANINNSFSPNLTIAYAGEDSSRVLHSLRYAMKCSSIMISIPIMILCVYGKSFYTLWQPTLDAGELAILSFFACFQFIPFAGPQVLFNVFTTTNKLKFNSLTVLAGGVTNVAVVIFLVKYTKLGLIAIASVSSIISLLRNLVITVPYAARLLKLKWYTFYRDVLLSCLCCALVGTTSFICQFVIVPNSWKNMVISVACASALSIVLLVIILLSKDERKLIINKIKEKING